MHAMEMDLLATNKLTVSSSNAPKIFADHVEFPYVLAYESDKIGNRWPASRIRVWDTCKFKKRWPGLQPQIIQVVDANCMVLTAKKVGGDPMMTDAWTAQMYNVDRLFVYIKCKLRGRFNVQGVYIYEIDDTLSIIERGIYFDKEDLAKEKKRFEEEGRRWLDEYKKTSSNQVPDDKARKLADPQH